MRFILKLVDVFFFILEKSDLILLFEKYNVLSRDLIRDIEILSQRGRDF